MAKVKGAKKVAKKARKAKPRIPQKRPEKLAAGWYVKFKGYREAADYAERKGLKRLAQKLRRMAAEEEKKWK